MPHYHPPHQKTTDQALASWCYASAVRHGLIRDDWPKSRRVIVVDIAPYLARRCLEAQLLGDSEGGE